MKIIRKKKKKMQTGRLDLAHDPGSVNLFLGNR